MMHYNIDRKVRPWLDVIFSFIVFLILELTYHDDAEIDLENSSDFPASECSFVSVIYLFDGIKSLEEVFSLFPLVLREYGLDITIFLLR
jgi:hypothetical protein